MAIPFWLKIAGPLIAVAILLGSFMAWSKHQYNSGYKSGVTATDKKWEDAAKQLKVDASKSATKADDAAVNRLNEQVNQISADQEAVNKAEAEGKSPLDAIFGGGK